MKRRNLMEYTTLLGTDPSTLSTEVNALIRHGWRPQGGVMVMAMRDEETQEEMQQGTQGMVKESNADSHSLDEEPLEALPHTAILSEDERILSPLRLVHARRAR